MFSFLLFVLLLYTGIRFSSKFGTKKRLSRDDKLRRSFLKALFTALTISLKQVSAYRIRRKQNIMGLTLFSIILFCFWIQSYFCSLIKTELSVVGNPITIEDYDDILIREKILPMWLSTQNDKEVFSKAEHGTKEAMIWRKAVSMTRGDINKAMYTPDVETSLAAFRSAYFQNSVLLLGRFLQLLVRSNMCAAVSVFGDRHSMALEDFNFLTRLTSDPGSREMVQASLFNSRLDPRPKKIIDETLQRNFESGVIDEATRKRVFLFEKSSEDTMRDCMSDLVIKQCPEIHKPNVYHFISLFEVMTIALVISKVSLFCEITWNALYPKRKH
jgi:hypothetical protein